MRRLLPLLLLAAAPALANPSPADLEAALNADWKDGFVVVRVPIASDCDEYYNDNDVRGGRATSSAGHRFASGELARVERIGVKRGGRVDVFLDLVEQVLDTHVDGPFTLYDAKSCRVQLKLEGAGSRGLSEAEDVLGGLMELYPDAYHAEASSSWNGRRREALPPDYEQTLADYRAWKAAQTNAAVQARMSEAILEAARTNDRMRSDADYLAGFAAGVERARDHSFGDCGSLVEVTFYPENERGKGEAWESGYADGQRLAFDLELLRRLAGCFVAVPAPG